MFKIFYVFLLIIVCSSCKDDVIVKPSAKLRLDYPQATYKKAESNCGFTFLINDFATLEKKPNCGFVVTYPKMNASIYLTYQDVRKNNLDSLLHDAQKLVDKHVGKANGIPEHLFVNPDKNVYGMFFSINGNAATQAEFYITDSIRHFLNGALYFNTKPNYDSIFPAAEYLREDIRQIMESVEWE